MKKIVIFLMVLCCFLAGTTSVSAASRTYNIKELDLSVIAPKGYTVLTRENIKENRSFLKKIDMTEEQVLDTLKKRNIYLDAITNDLMSEIVITITENKIGSFNAFNDAILLSLFDSFIPKIEKKGFCVSDYEIYEHPQIKFLKVYVADKLKTFQGVTYYTIYNYRAIGFTMRSQGALSEKQEKVIQDLVDSIKFNNVVVDEKADKSTPSFSYTDSYSKVVFTVPENWEQKQLSEHRQYTDVKFVSTQEEGMTITYEGIDLWGRMTKLEKRGHSRSSINLSFFTDSEIEELIGVSVENMKAVTYDNISYYQTEQCISSIIYGLPISMVMTQVIRIENGWMYMFQFSGEPDHKYFEDFISLINSVEYPQPEPEDYVVEKTVRSKDVVIAILILVTFVVVIVFVLHNNKKVYAKNDS